MTNEVIRSDRAKRSCHLWYLMAAVPLGVEIVDVFRHNQLGIFPAKELSVEIAACLLSHLGRCDEEKARKGKWIKPDAALPGQ